MMQVQWLKEYPKDFEEQLQFVVIVSKMQGKWIYCQHKQRSTWEVPGGHIEAGETTEQAAAREQYEETGAAEYTLFPLGAYQVSQNGNESFGALFFAQVERMETLPKEFEMKEVKLFCTPPSQQTYPQIQPKLVDWVESAGF